MLLPEKSLPSISKGDPEHRHFRVTTITEGLSTCRVGRQGGSSKWLKLQKLQKRLKLQTETGSD